MDVNWMGVAAGFVAAVALSSLWYGPLFGKTWAVGSHGITRPTRFPAAAMAVHLVATAMLAWLIGALALTDALIPALVAILAAAALQLSTGLFSQKSTAAALIDGGCVLAMGAVMIAAQGIF